MTAALPKKILHVSAKCSFRIQHKSLDSNALRTFVFLVVVLWSTCIYPTALN